MDKSRWLTIRACSNHVWSYLSEAGGAQVVLKGAAPLAGFLEFTRGNFDFHKLKISTSKLLHCPYESSFSFACSHVQYVMQWLNMNCSKYK